MSADKKEYISLLIIELGSLIAKLALQKTSIMQASPVKVSMQFPGDYSLARTYPLGSYGHRCILEKRVELSTVYNSETAADELCLVMRAQLTDPVSPQLYCVDSRKDVIIKITGDVIQDSEAIKERFWKWVSSKHAPGRIMNDYLLEVQKTPFDTFSTVRPEGLSVGMLKYVVSNWVQISDKDSNLRQVLIAGADNKLYSVNEIRAANIHASTMDERASADLVLVIKPD